MEKRNQLAENFHYILEYIHRIGFHLYFGYIGRSGPCPRMMIKRGTTPSTALCPIPVNGKISTLVLYSNEWSFAAAAAAVHLVGCAVPPN